MAEFNFNTFLRGVTGALEGSNQVKKDLSESVRQDRKEERERRSRRFTDLLNLEKLQMAQSKFQAQQQAAEELRGFKQEFDFMGQFAGAFGPEVAGEIPPGAFLAGARKAGVPLGFAQAEAKARGIGGQEEAAVGKTLTERLASASPKEQVKILTSETDLAKARASGKVTKDVPSGLSDNQSRLVVNQIDNTIRSEKVFVTDQLENLVFEIGIAEDRDDESVEVLKEKQSALKRYLEFLKKGAARDSIRTSILSEMKAIKAQSQ